jgi:hypothetical protein
MTTIKGYSDQLVTTVMNSGAFARYPDWSGPMAKQLAREACRRLELDEISRDGVALKGLAMEALNLAHAPTAGARAELPSGWGTPGETGMSEVEGGRNIPVRSGYDGFGFGGV